MRMVVLDEINIALRYDYLEIAEVVDVPEEFKAADDACRSDRAQCQGGTDRRIADLVTEMTLVKHPFRSGIKAQPGVEF